MSLILVALNLKRSGFSNYDRWVYLARIKIDLAAIICCYPVGYLNNIVG